MHYCYLCGRPIPPKGSHIRRRVKTGELQNRPGRNKTVTPGHSTFGMRIVCRICADRLDGNRNRVILIANIKALAAAAIILALLFGNLLK